MSKNTSQAIWQNNNNCYVRLHISPNASKDSISIKETSYIKVSIKAKAESGQANERLILFLSKILLVPESSLSIYQGRSSKKKIIQIKDFDANLLIMRLKELSSQKNH